MEPIAFETFLQFYASQSLCTFRGLHDQTDQNIHLGKYKSSLPKKKEDVWIQDASSLSLPKKNFGTKSPMISFSHLLLCVRDKERKSEMVL